MEGPGKSAYSTCLFKERETWVPETRSEPQCPAQCVIRKGGPGNVKVGGRGVWVWEGCVDGWVKDKQEQMSM